jgi:hypothetical protein
MSKSVLMVGGPLNGLRRSIGIKHTLIGGATYTARSIVLSPPDSLGWCRIRFAAPSDVQMDAEGWLERLIADYCGDARRRLDAISGAEVSR